MLGATGDLAERKLYPAIASLAQRGQLPSSSACSAWPVPSRTDDGFLEECKVAVKAHPDVLDAFEQHVACTKYVTGAVDYQLHLAVNGLDVCVPRPRHGGNHVFYL